MNKILFAVAAALAIVGAMNFMSNKQAAPRFLASQDPVEAAWNMWKRQEGRSYGTDSEETYRMSVFKTNYNNVNTFNSKPQTATLKLNKFADLTKAEFKKQYTNLKRNKAFGAKAPKAKLNRNLRAPDTYDARNDGLVNSVKDQGQCGSCWAFSTVAAIEGAKAKSGQLQSFSEQMLVDCDRNGNFGCNGGDMGAALDWVVTNPLALESEYPYTARDGICSNNSQSNAGSIRGRSQITGGPAEIRQAVYQYGTASVAIEADQDVFQFYDGGVITSGCGSQLDHGVAIVGYGNEDGSDYFLVRNSWGSSWGEAGYVKISPNECGIQSEVNVAEV